MLKWCKNAVYKSPSEVFPVIAQCQKSLLEGHSYQILDASFREEVDIVAMISFPQQKIEQTSLGTHRQICHLHLDDRQAISAMQEIKQENRQYQAWIRNIKIALQNINDYEDEWETSIESILKELSIENADLLEECKRTAKEIQSLEELLEKIQKDKVEIINAIDSYQPLEVSEESIKRHSFSSSTETIIPEETSTKYVRRTSREFSYSSKESGYSSEESIYSSTETIVPEESESVFMQTNTQITELEKKNKIYKIWIESLNKKLNSNLTLNYLKLSKTDLKMLEDLKIPSFKNVELKQENKKNEETIPSLEARTVENIEINAAYQDLLSEEIYLYKLDKLEERLVNEQKESREIDSYLKNADQVHANMEKFTECLIQTKKLISLLKI